MEEQPTFKLMHQDWFKRRIPMSDTETITNIEVRLFERRDNSYCTLIVEYDNTARHVMEARVNVNDQNGRWTVHGINPHGVSILLEVS